MWVERNVMGVSEIRSRDHVLVAGGTITGVQIGIIGLCFAMMEASRCRLRNRSVYAMAPQRRTQWRGQGVDGIDVTPNYISAVRARRRVMGGNKRRAQYTHGFGDWPEGGRSGRAARHTRCDGGPVIGVASVGAGY